MVAFGTSMWVAVIRAIKSVDAIVYIVRGMGMHDIDNYP
jgi:hypothetical protein